MILKKRGWLGAVAAGALVATSLGGAAFAATGGAQSDTLGDDAAVQTAVGDTQGTPSEDVVEQQSAFGSVSWSVVDPEGAPLGGTTWTIETVDGDVVVPDIKDCVEEGTCDGTDQDPAAGAFTVGGLRLDSYVLRQVVAPDGYAVAEQTVGFGIYAESPDFTVEHVFQNVPEQLETAEAEGLTVADDAPTTTIEPLASGTTMDVVVRKRVFANPSSLNGDLANTIGTNYNKTAGSRFELWTYTNYNAGPVAKVVPGITPGWPSGKAASCEVVAGGQCTIEIPNASTSGQNGNQGRRFWVVEAAAADGTYSNPKLYVGSYTGPRYGRQIAGLTRPVQGNRTDTMPMAINDSNGATAISASELPGNINGQPNMSTAIGASFGAVANSLDNPLSTPSCAPGSPRIAIMLDRSSSISSGQWTTFRNAIVGTGGLLDTLASTTSVVSTAGFGTGASWLQETPLSPSDAGDRQELEDSIPTSRWPSNTAQYTNWTAALKLLGSGSFDIVLFVTDGAPNYVSLGSSLQGTGVDGSNVTLRSLEAPIYAANALKNQGARVLAVGVGNAIDGVQAEANLRALSGPQKDQDYFLTKDWNALQTQLTEIVKQYTCLVPVTVVKETYLDGVLQEQNAGGWQFTASDANFVPPSTNHDGVTIDGKLVGTPTGNTVAEKGLTWDLSFSEPSGQVEGAKQTASLKVSESDPRFNQDGWTLTGIDCPAVDGVTITPNVDSGTVYISNVVSNSGPIKCTFKNSKSTKGSLEVTKKDDQTPHSNLEGAAFQLWKANEAGVQGPPTTQNSTKVGEPQTTGVGGTVAWSDLEHGTYFVEETAAPTGHAVSDPNWQRFVVSGDSLTHQLSFTNSRLPGAAEWQKVDDQSPAVGLAGSEWSLAGPAGFTTMPVTAEVCTGLADPQGSPFCTYTATGNFKVENLPWGTYTLTETKAPEGHTGSTEPFSFEVTKENAGTTQQLGTGGEISNARIPGGAQWNKIDQNGTDLAGSEWSLAGPAGFTTMPVTAEVCTGLADPQGSPFCTYTATGNFKVENLPWGTYTLTETKAPPGYVPASEAYKFTIDAANAGTTITVGPEGGIKNAQKKGPVLPLTGGQSAAMFTALGLLVLGGAGGGAVYAHKRRLARRE